MKFVHAKRMFSIAVLLFFGLSIIISFQNCGMSGFITSQDSAVVPGEMDLSSSNGTTNLTTLPKGQLTHFEIPDQLVSLKIAIMEMSQDQLLGYSFLLSKFVTISLDGKSYQEVSIADTQVTKILTVRAFQKYNPGVSRSTNLVPAVLVTYLDQQGKTLYGVFVTKSRNWTRLDFAYECSPMLRGSSGSSEIVAYCTDSRDSKNYFQRLDLDGSKIGGIVQTSEAFEFSNAKPSGSNTFFSNNWTKKINTATGSVTTLPAITPTLESWATGVYRSDRNTLVYLASDYLSIVEVNLVTGQSTTLLSSIYQFNTFAIDENSFIVYNQQTRAKYIVSAVSAATVTPVGDEVLGYAISSKHLALFSPNPNSATIRMDVKLFDVKTLEAVSLCSAAAPSGSDFYGNMIGYNDFNSFFANSIGTDPQVSGMNMAFIMDRSCNDLYLPTISNDIRNDKYIRTMYKYNISTFQNQVLLSNTIDRDGNGYFGNFLALDNGSLYFTLANNNDAVYATNGSGSLSNMLVGRTSSQYNGDSPVAAWNYSIIRMQLASGQGFSYLLPREDTGIVRFSLPKIKSTPMAKFLTNGGKNYVLMIRESDSDTATTEAYGFQFYNENHVLVKREQVKVNIFSPTITYMSRADYANTESPYIGMKLSSPDNGTTKNTFMIANLQTQTVSVVEAPTTVTFTYDTIVTADGNVLGFGGFCQVNQKRCISNPFNEVFDNTNSASMYISNYTGGFYYINLYVGNMYSFRQYSYDGNVGFTKIKDFGSNSGAFSLDNRFLYFYDYGTKKTVVHDIDKNTSRELTNLFDSVSPIKGGLFASLKEANDTYSHWYVDFATLNAQKIDDLSGGVESFYPSTGTATGLTNNIGSDLLIVFSPTQCVFVNLVTKKVVKRFSMPQSSLQVWEGDGKILLGQLTAMSYIPVYASYKYKLVLMDLKTLAEQEIDISQYSTFICRGFSNSDTYCIGEKSGRRYLLRYLNGSTNFEEVTELNSERYFGGLVKLGKDLTFFSFSAVNYVQRYMNIGSPRMGTIGDGWEGYVYKK